MDNPKQQFNTRSKSCVSIFIRTGLGILLNEFLPMMPSASSRRVAAISRGKTEEHVGRPQVQNKGNAFFSPCGEKASMHLTFTPAFHA